MSWRLKRKLIIIGGIVFFFVSFSGLWYWYSRPEPTCFDGKKNGSELDVDCGGGCARVCSLEVSPVVNLWTRVFEITPNNYTAVSLFNNPNTGLGSPRAEYLVDYRDTTGRTIATTTGFTFINPGQVIPIFLPNFMSSSTPLEKVFVNFIDINWQRIGRPAPDINVVRTNFEKTPIPRITVRVTNNEVFDLQNVRVVAVLSDEDNNGFTSSATIINNIKSKDTVNAYFTWPVPFPIEPTFFDFYVESNVFDLPQF
ncbi:MAG: hypothetical protein WDZ73_00400 [Candidatus Paceibacterota bacterium]